MKSTNVKGDQMSKGKKKSKAAMESESIDGFVGEVVIDAGLEHLAKLSSLASEAILTLDEPISDTADDFLSVFTAMVDHDAPMTLIMPVGTMLNLCLLHAKLGEYKDSDPKKINLKKSPVGPLKHIAKFDMSGFKKTNTECDLVRLQDVFLECARQTIANICVSANRLNAAVKQVIRSHNGMPRKKKAR